MNKHLSNEIVKPGHSVSQIAEVECNYRNDYFGDQICRPKTGTKAASLLEIFSHVYHGM